MKSLSGFIWQKDYWDGEVMYKNNWSKIDNEAGKIYGEWTIIKKIPTCERENPRQNYLARCSCGVEKPVCISNLRSGKSKSCGHARKNKYTFKPGDEYGELTIIRQENDEYGFPSSKYLCQCSCGKQIILEGNEIGHKNSCGCNPKCKRPKDTIGERYGRLTIIGISDKTDYKGYHTYKICQCDCGNITEVLYGNLLNHHTQSCGCLSTNGSNGENYLSDFLKQHSINFKRQYVIKEYKDKNPLPFDVAILSSNNDLLGLIEVQGEQHYNKNCIYYKDILWEHDKIKQSYCNENNIPFLTLDYSKGQRFTNFNKWNNEIIKFLKEIGIDGI